MKEACSSKYPSFFENIFSKNECGFRKGHSTQQCLLAMLEKWKRPVDSGKAFGALLIDLSEAFNCLDHKLLIIESLERATVYLFRWFENNLLKGNADKCYFLISTSQEVSLNLNNFKRKSSDC